MTKEQKRRAALYREAARRVELGEDRSCITVAAVDGIEKPFDNYDKSAAVREYADFMFSHCRPWRRDLPAMDEIWGFQFLLGKDDSTDDMAVVDFDSALAQDIRVLALCFMACAVETGDA
jgi:hypothetical protein